MKNLSLSIYYTHSKVHTKLTTQLKGQPRATSLFHFPPQAHPKPTHTQSFMQVKQKSSTNP